MDDRHMKTTMKKKKFNLIFLGERTIAERALSLLKSEEFVKIFDLKVIVTGQLTYDRFFSETSIEKPKLILNDKRRTEDIVSAINEVQANLLISVQHNWILTKEILSSVNGFAFNLHNAKLPDYKGYNSIAHAIMNGDTIFSSTIHWMAEEVDTGNIAYVRDTEIGAEDTALSLYSKSILAAELSLVDLLRGLSGGAVIPSIELDRGAGVFYEKDSVSKLANLTGIEDPSYVARAARAVFFPPLNMAYKVMDGRRFFVVPEGGLLSLLSVDGALLAKRNLTVRSYAK